MSLQALIDELTNDPLSRVYSAMTDEEAAADLNTVYRTRNRTSMSGDELFQQTNATEWAGLTEVKQNQWLAFCGRDSIDPFAAANVQFVQNIFGAGATVSALLAARLEDVSRATELGLSRVREGTIIKARAA